MVSSACRTSLHALIAGSCFFCPAYAAQSETNAGILTCTVSKASDTAQTDVELSCNFRSRDGKDSDYSGFARRSDPSGFPKGRLVFVWSVVAPGTSDMPLLDGTYLAEGGVAQTSVLVGGKDGTVRLESETGAAQSSTQPTPTLLSLKLAATKA